MKILSLPIFLTFITSGLQAEDDLIPLCWMDKRNKKAVVYCGTRPSGGRCQLQILQLEGLKKSDKVLEIGHGALMSAIPIMSFLEKGHYFGIDPNPWLVKSSLKIPENRKVVEEQQPHFLRNNDFDASSFGIPFDYIFAHSVMSHAAYWQLPLFLEKCANVLKDGGKLVFSIRLTEKNEFGNEGANQETHSAEWVYPNCSFFHRETVVREASQWFRLIEHKKNIRCF